MALAADLLLVWAFLLAFLAILAAPLAFRFRRFRRRAVLYATAGVVFIPSWVVGECRLGKLVWRDAVSRFERRSDPLVRAIAAYQAERNRPPSALDDLVPTYLPVVPSTGIGASPKYRYLVGEKAGRYDGNPWVLIASPPCHPMGFDLLLYFPLQNYPDTGYGGWLQRIGSWAYVHE